MKRNTEKALRLQVYLSHAGVASRRAAEKLITEGRITVNGKQVSVLGEKVFYGDDIRFDGKKIQIENRHLYLALNKPPLYISSSSDPQGRPLALDLLPPCEERLYSVGRLDYNSRGLLLFTNDGDFAAHVSHPGAGIEKEYLAYSTVPVPDSMVEEFSRGVIIDNILYRALEIEKMGKKSLRIILVEGKNREIRRVFSYFHLHLESLQRIRIGPVKLGDLPEGDTRALSKNEIKILYP
ncbi:MAG: rRNA pseudouridine synthase [Treponema sp.]|nr:rRNA pseudouridine synthase [Treponema sp.]